MVDLSELILRFGIRRDAWRPDYESAVQLEGFEASQESVDVQLEYPPGAWRPLAPSLTREAALASLGPLVVVDGVRRLHMRLFFEHAGQLKYSGLGTAAVGALRIQPGQPLAMREALSPQPEVTRYALLGKLPLDLGAEQQITGIPHPFQTLYVADIQDSQNPDAPVQALQQAMRDREQIMVQRVQAGLMQSSALGTVLVDGPLQKFSAAGQSRVVGFVKTLHTQYLPAPQQAVLQDLGAGERTPLFRIGQKQVSWYLRLAPLEPIDHPLSGLVRLEVLNDKPTAHLASLQALADSLAVVLPMLVVPRYKDPRSPQNLLPIQALEQQLKSLIGNETLLQRHLEAYLYALHRQKLS